MLADRAGFCRGHPLPTRRHPPFVRPDLREYSQEHVLTLLGPLAAKSTRATAAKARQRKSWSSSPSRPVRSASLPDWDLGWCVLAPIPYTSCVRTLTDDARSLVPWRSVRRPQIMTAGLVSSQFYLYGLIKNALYVLFLIRRHYPEDKELMPFPESPSRSPRSQGRDVGRRDPQGLSSKSSCIDELYIFVSYRNLLLSQDWAEGVRGLSRAPVIRSLEGAISVRRRDFPPSWFYVFSVRGSYFKQCTLLC